MINLFSQRFVYQNKEVPAESAPAKVYEKKDLNEAVDTVGQLTQNIEKAEGKRNQLVEKVANMGRDDFIKAWSSYQLNNGQPVTYEAYQDFIDTLAVFAPQNLKDRLLTLLPPDHKLPPLRVEFGQEEALSSEIDEKKYAKRFSPEARKSLHKAGIPPEKANAYKYEASDIIDFVQNYHLEPAEVNPYAKFNGRGDEIRIFFASDVNALVRARVSIFAVEDYPDYLNGEAIAHLYERGIFKMPNYSARFTRHFDVSDLIVNDITPEQAEKYPKRFDAYDIAHLVKGDVKPEQTKEWASSRFSGLDIAHLVKAGITRDQADEYPLVYKGPHRTFKLGGLTISYLHAHSIRAESLKAKTVTDPLYHERFLADYEEQLKKGDYWKPGDPIRPVPPLEGMKGIAPK